MRIFGLAVHVLCFHLIAVYCVKVKLTAVQPVVTVESPGGRSQYEQAAIERAKEEHVLGEKVRLAKESQKTAKVEDQLRRRVQSKGYWVKYFQTVYHQFLRRYNAAKTTPEDSEDVDDLESLGVMTVDSRDAVRSGEAAVVPDIDEDSVVFRDGEKVENIPV